MARTQAGATLTETHRRGQLQVRARALRDFMTLWPLWDGDAKTFQRLLTASMPLIRNYHTLSSSLAAGYYEAFRIAERVEGTGTPRVAPPLDEEEVRGTLFVVGAAMTRDAIASGFSPQAAMQNALTRTSGSVTRFAMTGGRDTLVLSSGADKRAGGWARVTGGSACAFCGTLAARGAVYSDDTSDFQAHDHCSCAAEPQYPGAELPPSSERWKELYDRAQQEQDASGTSNDRLNNLRRQLAAQ